MGPQERIVANEKTLQQEFRDFGGSLVGPAGLFNFSGPAGGDGTGGCRGDYQQQQNSGVGWRIERADAEELMRHDRCATLEDQLRWLRDAGFEDVDCLFKMRRFAVIAATRASISDLS